MQNKTSEILIIIDFGNSNTKVCSYLLDSNNLSNIIPSNIILSDIITIEKNETETKLKLYFDDLISNTNKEDNLKIKVIYSNVTNFEFEKFVSEKFFSEQFVSEKIEANYLPNVTFNSYDIRQIFVELEKINIIKFNHILGIGTDRLLGLISSYLKYKTSCITIDFGTAITLNYIDESGKVIGGQIIPGYFTQLTSLNINTDKIKLTNHTEGEISEYNKLINLNLFEIIGKAGDNTSDAVSWGIINAICGSITNFISTNSTNQTNIVNVIFTGSYSIPFYDYFHSIYNSNSNINSNINTNLSLHQTTNLNLSSIYNIYKIHPELFK